MRQLKIGTSWVRGVVGDSLTPELIVNLGCAFGTYCDGKTVVIGRDTRQSSDMLRAAVVSSLLSTGCRVVDLGFSPTPLVSFAVRQLEAAGGLSITGGHNDSRWNALKFIGADGALLNAISSEEVLDIYHAAEFARVPWDGLKAWDCAPDILGRYLDHITTALDVERIRSARLRVAVDFCNGTGAAVAAPLLDALGCKLILLNEEPEAEFAHPPAPSVENMRQLAALLRYLSADLGVALNIDGDRIGFVTAEGTPLSEEDSFPLVADYLLSRSPGPVVTNLSTSHMIDEVARRYGQPVIRTYIGEGYVVDKGLTAHAAIAGEGSGGIAILPTVATFDGFLALGLVLEAMAARGETLAALAGRLPRYVMKKGSLSCPPDRVHAVMEHFRALYPDRETDQTDGLLVRWEDAWLHVRGSNTEPIVRIIAEAKDAARAESLFEEAMTRAHRVVYGNVERPQ
ncbi:MAG: phosphoglucosamine mutase [Armatimonadetes bacterium]|nr:phosphoglucosamine mutase [Armatimonadota bacterium]